MKNFIIYASLLLSCIVTKAVAQETVKVEALETTFELRVKLIANKIEAITKQEKAALKAEIESVNKELESGTITKEQADEKKLKFAEIRSKNIETRVGEAQEELKELVNQKVAGKIKDGKEQLTVKWSWSKNDSIRKSRGERRTTSQFVFAAGVNNLVTDKAVAHSDYRYWGSHFYEWGFTSNTRLFKNDNLLHLKYGMSLMYNNLRPTDNRLFVVNGNQTNLETSSVNLKDSRFRNVYLTVPLHLEFDFTKSKDKDGKKIFRTHESVRFGIGGYAGARVKSKQKLCYELNGNDISVKEKGDFNANDFIYGVSTYIGYGETSLYLKYDLNPLFKDNAIKQNNISLGVRFDFN
ncbi:hypothetical protein IVB69_03770 [Flavobacterium sp. J49]|uniref:hypothetical protein n=1 Tax=Flavobacterium sp. J49 TaxID=2718534 RepID=UPI001593E3A6|nr:hypothetical protein [Flavobacterium sp. J49]MBF6640588.1 hypothetical protein [Flavobacterium sp. J49]NIC01835.1 hypothetical protein [Flavobacterium sp. J49]